MRADSEKNGAELDVDENAADLLSALDDTDCRRIIRALQSHGDPLTAYDLRDECGIPHSTVYRKLRMLRGVGLVRELTEIRSDGKHTNAYRLGFTEIQVRLTQDNLHIENSTPETRTDGRRDLKRHTN